MTPYPMSDPFHLSGSGDRTWSLGAWARVQWIVLPIGVLVVFTGVEVSFIESGTFGWFSWAMIAMTLLAVPAFVLEVLRSAHRVTLRRDGTVELVRPIGTVRLGIDQVRAMRVPRFDNNQGTTSIRMETDRGTYRIQRQLADTAGLADALRARNPRIELPSL